MLKHKNALCLHGALECNCQNITPANTLLWNCQYTLCLLAIKHPWYTMHACKVKSFEISLFPPRTVETITLKHNRKLSVVKRRRRWLREELISELAKPSVILPVQSLQKWEVGVTTNVYHRQLRVITRRGLYQGTHGRHYQRTPLKWPIGDLYVEGLDCYLHGFELSAFCQSLLLSVLFRVIDV